MYDRKALCVECISFPAFLVFPTCPRLLAVKHPGGWGVEQRDPAACGSAACAGVESSETTNQGTMTGCINQTLHQDLVII